MTPPTMGLPDSRLTSETERKPPLVNAVDQSGALNEPSGALIVYDMQVGITRQIGDRERVLQQVRHVLDSARQARVIQNVPERLRHDQPNLGRLGDRKGTRSV
jgi:hypothetical protein